jgi:hypothetical protein
MAPPPLTRRTSARKARLERGGREGPHPATPGNVTGAAPAVKVAAPTLAAPVTTTTGVAGRSCHSALPCDCSFTAPASAASLAGTQEPATRPAESASHSQSERSKCGQKQSPQSESAPSEASRRGTYRQEWCPRQDSQDRPRRFQPPRKLGCSQCFREGHGWFGKRSIGVGVGHE